MFATISAERRFPNRRKANAQCFEHAFEHIWRLESASPLVAATGIGRAGCPQSQGNDHPVQCCGAAHREAFNSVTSRSISDAALPMSRKVFSFPSSLG